MEKSNGIWSDLFPVDVCYSAKGFVGKFLHGIYRHMVAFESHRHYAWTLADAFNEGFDEFALSIDSKGHPCTELFGHDLENTYLADILNTLNTLSLLTYKGEKKVKVYIWLPRNLSHTVETIQEQIKESGPREWPRLEILFRES